MCRGKALSMRSSPLCPNRESAVKLLVNTILLSTVSNELLVKVSVTNETALLYPSRASLDQQLFKYQEIVN